MTDETIDAVVLTATKHVSDAEIRLQTDREIRDLLSASKPAATQELPQAVLDALRFYAHGHHYNIDDDHQQFDTVSGEPQNWLFSERDDDCTMIEDGSIAKAVLLGGLPGFEEPAEPIEGEVFTAAPTFDLSQEFVTRASEDADAPSVIGNTIPAEPIGWKLVPVEPTVEMLNAALGHDSTFGHGFKRRIYQEMLAAAPAVPAQSAEPVRLSESDVAALYSSSAHDPLSGFTAKLNAALDRVGPQPSQTAVALDDERAWFKKNAERLALMPLDALVHEVWRARASSLQPVAQSVEQTAPSDSEIEAMCAEHGLGPNVGKLVVNDALKRWGRPVSQPVEQTRALTDGARDVLAERHRQVSVEGWTPEHDDVHDRNELSRAAACYALEGIAPYIGYGIDIKRTWSDTGWSWNWWKPKDHRRNLVKAGALILAEIERIDRAAEYGGERS